MNLIVDVGNTYTKLAVFDQNTVITKHRVKRKDVLDTLKLIQKEFPLIQQAILSLVGTINKSAFSYIESHYDMLVLSANTKLPFENLYGTPSTLGIDRIALVSASVEQFPSNNVLIIDAGTCITYDFINDANQYLGGAISPGIRTRYTSLNNLTANLPLLETEQPKNIIGDSTETSIHSGIINGIIFEIDGVVNEYQKKYSDLTIILTGGDAKFLSKRLKSSIFANSNFLLKGLNYILQFNSN
jgi:type III pantothenate kinase